MTKREIVRSVLDHHQPPYVPWSVDFTVEAEAKLRSFYQAADLDTVVGNHLLELGSGTGFFVDLGNNRVQDRFGVIWNRSMDKDIGNVEGLVLPEPTLAGYTFPDPCASMIFDDIPEKIAAHGDRFRVFKIGFSLYERAWTMRGMENLLMDFIDHPDFVRDLFDAIAEYNIAQVKKALEFDIDAVYFGDDWGQQRGLQMGPRLWRQLIFPVLKRMYGFVRSAGKYVFIHSCGDVDELLPELVSIGVNCFNPFQPEVMDVFSLLDHYHGCLTFHGGLSTQYTLPFGSVGDVQRATRRLLEAGRMGGYIFSPAHAVEGDVPVENMLAFIEILQSQPGMRP